MSRVTGRPPNWRGMFPADDDDRYKASQIVDANRGIFWGKHGRALQRERMVSYPRSEIAWRGGAWSRLLKEHPEVPQHHWRKRHTLTEWRWVWISDCPWEGCESCRTRDRELGLRHPGDPASSLLWREGDHLPEPDAGGGSGTRCDPDYCDNCGNTIQPPEFVVYSEAEFATASTNVGESCLVCTVCDSLKREDAL